MRVHWLQHAEHEGLGSIAPWLAARGLRLRGTRLYAGEMPPAPDEFDWLIVMGGPMNIYEHERHPWLIAEKKLIRDACVRNKKILGICLGAQLLADVTGGRVTQNKCQEIGWFDVQITAEGASSPFLQGLPATFKPFHWHGDTFSIPKGSANLLKSDACVNQAFDGPGRLGLQFHLEVTLEDARRWLELESPVADHSVQDAAEILREPARFEENARLMGRILERFL
jgi:GMP synthase-like glutamine amidotransferase